MDGSGEVRLPQRHVTELSSFFAAHDRYQGATADTAALALNAIALEQARKIIEDMPPRQKKVALMRWQDHMKASEIAAELGIAESTVHAHLHAARGKLTAGLERYCPFGI